LCEAGPLDEADPQKTQVLLMWSVASAQAQWLTRLDATALDCLDADAWIARRWLRLSPRFLGRMAHRLRLLHCNREFATLFIEQVQQRVDRGEIAVAVEIRLHYLGRQDTLRFAPGESASANHTQRPK
jgi:hypothetical protein